MQYYCARCEQPCGLRRDFDSYHNREVFESACCGAGVTDEAGVYIDTTRLRAVYYTTEIDDD